MTRLAPLRLLLALAAAGLLLGSCASAPTVDPSKGRVIEITMKEFGFSPTTITVAPGEKVTLKFINKGMLEHEFMAGRAPVPSRGYGEDWIKRAVPGLAQHTHVGEEHLGEGVRVSNDWIGWLTLVVPPESGTYEFGCFIAGHYEAGMKGKLIVR